MVGIAEKIRWVLSPGASPIFDFTVGNDGKTGDQIVFWNAVKLGAQPSQATINAVTDQQVADAIKAKHDGDNPDLAAIRDAATAAINANTTYLAIASPSNAQVAAQVRALTQQNQQIIRAIARLSTAAIG